MALEVLESIPRAGPARGADLRFLHLRGVLVHPSPPMWLTGRLTAPLPSRRPSFQADWRPRRLLHFLENRLILCVARQSKDRAESRLARMPVHHTSPIEVQASQGAYRLRQGFVKVPFAVNCRPQHRRGQPIASMLTDRPLSVHRLFCHGLDQLPLHYSILWQVAYDIICQPFTVRPPANQST